MDCNETNACSSDLELVSRKEMARRLSISVRSLDRAIRAKRIPHVRLGGLVRLNPTRVMDAIHRTMEVKEIGAE